MTNLDLNLTDLDEEAFDVLVGKHDLTYGYSDDERWRRAGWDEFREIQLASKKLQPARAAMIWNYWVNRKLNGDAVELERWYWHDYARPNQQEARSAEQTLRDAGRIP